MNRETFVRNGGCPHCWPLEATEPGEYPPTTINEVIELQYDLGLETYYGFNMQQVMMKMDDKFMHELRAFVDRCRTERESFLHIDK